MIREGSIDDVLGLAYKMPEFSDLYSRDEFERRLKTTKSLILIAESEGEMSGFKCGYERENSSSFYSWMGGVVPAFRRNGIADALLKEMERWCKNEGYQSLTFKTLNDHKSMLIFALKRGFDIIGTEKSGRDERLRIWLKKQLI